MANDGQAKKRIGEAIDVLEQFGLPRAQINERTAYCLLALLNLTLDKHWDEAESPLVGITPMMEFAGDLLKAINDNQGNIYGLTVYAHGSPNGYIVSPTKKAIHQDELMSSLHSNGYRIAEANMMQCYSINPNGTMVDETGTEQPFNYKAAWEKTAVKVFGYEGINVFGIDF